MREIHLAVVAAGEVRIVGRCGVDHRREDRHRVGGVGKAFEVEAHALVEHLVVGEQRGEIGKLGGGGKFAIDQQIGGLDEGAFFREFRDVIAAVAKNALFTIDEGDRAFA